MGNYQLYRVGQFLAKVLPYKVSYAFVMWLCDLHYTFSKTDRQAVEHNLKSITNKDQVSSAEVREVFHNFGRYLLEFFTMKHRLDSAFVKSNVRINNIEYLNDVLQKGKGGVLVSAHVGNWEMGGVILPILGFPLSVVALAHKDPRVNALFNAQREAFGAQVIQTDVAVRRVMEHLKQNRLVAILGDRDFGNHGIMMDFFGSKTMIPKGSAYFAMKTGAPIVPIFFIRTSEDHFEINAYPPIDPSEIPHTKINDEAAKVYMKKYLTCIENEIKKSPSQWLLFREFGEECA